MTGRQTTPRSPEAFSKRLATDKLAKYTLETMESFDYRQKAKIRTYYGGNFLTWTLLKKKKKFCNCSHIDDPSTTNSPMHISTL